MDQAKLKSKLRPYESEFSNSNPDPLDLIGLDLYL